MSYTVGQKIRATYWVGVYKPNIGGFRTEMVSAELEQTGKCRGDRMTFHVRIDVEGPDMNSAYPKPKVR